MKDKNWPENASNFFLKIWNQNLSMRKACNQKIDLMLFIFSSGVHLTLFLEKSSDALDAILEKRASFKRVALTKALNMSHLPPCNQFKIKERWQSYLHINYGNDFCQQDAVSGGCVKNLHSETKEIGGYSETHNSKLGNQFVMRVLVTETTKTGKTKSKLAPQSKKLDAKSVSNFGIN